MSFPETCPFCMAARLGVKDGSWVTFACFTSIHVGQDLRRTQSRTCEGLERTRSADRLAALEAEAKQAREDEAWAHAQNVGCVQRGESGWQAYRWSVRMQWMDRENAPTIHAAIHALRAKVEGGAR